MRRGLLSKDLEEVREGAIWLSEEQCSEQKKWQIKMRVPSVFREDWVAGCRE